MTYLALRNSFPLSKAPVCVCVCVYGLGRAAPLSEQFELWQCVSGRESRPPPCYFTSLPSTLCLLRSPETTSVFSFSFSSLCWLSFFHPLKVSAETWNGKEEKSRAPFSQRAFITPYWSSCQNSYEPIALLLRCTSSFVSVSLFWRRPGFDGPVNPVNLHFNDC